MASFILTDNKEEDSGGFKMTGTIAECATLLVMAAAAEQKIEMVILGAAYAIKMERESFLAIREDMKECIEVIIDEVISEN
jgi:hypothetical protein